MLSWIQSAVYLTDRVANAPCLHSPVVPMKPQAKSEMEGRCSATSQSISGRPFWIRTQAGPWCSLATWACKGLPDAMPRMVVRCRSKW